MLHGSTRRLISVPPKLHFLPSHLNQIKPVQFSRQHNDRLDYFDHLLNQCKSVQQAQEIHAQIILTGSHHSGFLAAKLISVYSRLGLLLVAQKVFNTTSFECFSNLLLWNSILRANVLHGNYAEALKIYLKMRTLGIGADGFTFPLVIRACSLIGCSKLGHVLHCHVLQKGFQFHLHVVNELVSLYGKLGQIHTARQLFDRMNVRSYISWNTMISCFSLNCDCSGALEMFHRMESEGFEPNLVTWTSLLSSFARCDYHEETLHFFNLLRTRDIGASAESLAVVISVCADSVYLDKGKMVHGYVIKAGFGDFLIVKNSLISLYGKHGGINDAENIFLEIKTKNIVSWNSLISSYAELGFCDEALELFLQMEKEVGEQMVRSNVISWSAVICAFATIGRGEESLELFRKMQFTKVMANSVTISTVLAVCAELAMVKLGKEIHGHVIRYLMDNNILVGNGLINMYTKCGSLKEGYMVFNKISGRDIISWNSMITGYGMHGYGEDALRAFYHMIGGGVKPDGITFVAVLSACSHTGLISEGRRLFNEMQKEFKIEPKMEHYSCIVDLLGRAGFLQEASDIINSMPFEPNVCILGSFLNSCRMHKHTELAEGIASRIFNLSSEAAGSFMLLSNIYAANGRWEDSASVRVTAKTKGLKKSTGQSWIEVKTKVYVFSSGNSMQMGSCEVFKILEELDVQMEIDGYIPNNSFVLHDADTEEKRDIIWS